MVPTDCSFTTTAEDDQAESENNAETACDDVGNVGE